MTSQGLFRADLLLSQSRRFGPVLGLETGGPQASLAVASHGRIIAADMPARRAHGESVAGAIEAMLRGCNLKIGELAGIAVGIGPGSFTGLRIALSYAKGVALAAGCALVGIPSLDAMALCALELPDLAPAAAICPILDARKGELYAALYRQVENGVEKLSGEFLSTPEQLAARLEAATIFFGDGGCGELIRQAVHPDPAMLADWGAAPPPAVLIAALGAARIARGESDAAASLQPLYVRPSAAELKLKRPANSAGLEDIWSKGKKSSSANTQTTTRN